MHAIVVRGPPDATVSAGFHGYDDDGDDGGGDGGSDGGGDENDDAIVDDDARCARCRSRAQLALSLETIPTSLVD